MSVVIVISKHFDFYERIRFFIDIDRATKLIAKMRQCHIIVRDANRLHHFDPNGQCSCRDYFFKKNHKLKTKKKLEFYFDEELNEMTERDEVLFTNEISVFSFSKDKTTQRDESLFYKNFSKSKSTNWDVTEDTSD